ncbi:MAG: DUF3644 domain-containing protein [Bdellovibrionota bacterium]
MPRGLAKAVKDNLIKSRASAIAAVSAYNRPGADFRTHQFIVFITMAWTALFHAIFYKQGKKPWYKKKKLTSIRGRYIRVDGEPKHWDLSECLNQYFGGNHPPERKNLEFLIGLRNKIEHRHLPELDATLYGECQAALMNLEDFLASTFGDKYYLSEQLAMSLQFSRITPAEKKKAAQKLVTGIAKDVAVYVEKFRGGLPSLILDDQRYSFSVFLVPKVSNRKSAAEVAIEFVKAKNLTQEERERLVKLNVLIKEKHIPIQNLDLFRPGDVLQRVKVKISSRVTMSDHTNAWKRHNVRPAGGAATPKETKSQYCIYDEAHRDYVYTQSWIDLLIDEFSRATTPTSGAAAKAGNLVHEEARPQ